MTIIAVGDYRPDVPAYLSTHATVADGVYPKPDGSDGPLRAGVTTSATLSSAPISAFAARHKTGTVYIYAARAFAAVINVKQGTSFAGYFTGATGHATPVFPWRFTQFGDYVVVTNPVDGVMAHQIGSTSDFTAMSGAPAAAFIATIEPGFVMLGYTDDGSTQYPNRLHWSGINDHTSWPTVGTSAAASAQSDTQDLPNGGAITGILAAVGGAAGCVLTERGVYRLEYIGAPAVFAVREVIRGTGNVCVNASISVDGLAYFISDDGFQRFDGQSLQPIGQGRVSATFWSDVDREQLHRVNVAHDPLRKIIIWAYPNASATSGNPNKWLIYSYATDRWRIATDAAVTCSLLFTCVADHVTLDNFDTYFPLGMDGYTAKSLDGPGVNGGAPIISSFDASFNLVTHNGATIAALVETGETDAQGSRVYVSGIRPLTDATTATAAVGHRADFSASVTYTSLTAQGSDAICPQRIATRYARARVYIPSAGSWTYLQGADVMFRQEGKR